MPDERREVSEEGAALRRMGELRMFVDPAHASPRLIDDVIAEVRRLHGTGRPAPAIVVSHTGLGTFIPGSAIGPTPRSALSTR